MSKRYLFSPVGNTDPIKYFHDGSLLHICRYYKPDVVYLYLSKEMAEIHDRDNRYAETIHLLGEYMNHDFRVEVIKDTDLIEVQQYDLFYEKFRKYLGKIEEEMETDDELIVNMASGTPSMKSALLILATLAEYRFLPIQVSTPKKCSNNEFEERRDYDISAYWDLNEDNYENAENRCQEVRCLHLMSLLKKDMIKKHMLSYNYKAALDVAKEIKSDLSKEALLWLEVAESRSALDWDRMNKNLPSGSGVVTRVKTGDIARYLFEYMLSLELKAKRGEYGDFVRAITPLSVDLLEIIIEKKCNIDIKQYYESRNKHKWSEEKLENSDILEILDNAFNGKFRFGPVYSSHLWQIIQEKCEDKILVTRVQELIDIEQKVRNIAAHEIVCVTDAWIKDNTGKRLADIIYILKYICQNIGIITRVENWQAYDLMNEYIITVLDNDFATMR